MRATRAPRSCVPVSHESVSSRSPRAHHTISNDGSARHVVNVIHGSMEVLVTAPFSILIFGSFALPLDGLEFDSSEGGKAKRQKPTSLTETDHTRTVGVLLYMNTCPPAARPAWTGQQRPARAGQAHWRNRASGAAGVAYLQAER